MFVVKNIEKKISLCCINLKLKLQQYKEKYDFVVIITIY